MSVPLPLDSISPDYVRSFPTQVHSPDGDGRPQGLLPGKGSLFLDKQGRNCVHHAENFLILFLWQLSPLVFSAFFPPAFLLEFRVVAFIH